MNVDSTTRLIQVVDAIAKTWTTVVRSIVQPLLDEGIALRKPLEKIFILDIVHWNVQMLIATYEWSVILEFPVQHRDNVCDVAVFQRLRTS